MPTINAIGFGVLDYLYTDVDYSSPAFQRYKSKSRGDGGISPGHLCFVDAWEKYTGKSLQQIRRDTGWDREPDKFNVGGPCLVAVINTAQLTAPFTTKVRYYGVVANDKTAELMHGILGKTPLDVSHVKVSQEGSSPYAICLSDPNYNNGAGERSFTINIGVYATTPLERIIDDSFFEGDILFFGATAMTPTIHEHLTDLLEKSKRLNKITVVATIFDHISESKAPGKPWAMGADPDKSFRNMDLLMVDWDEALGISGKHNINDAIEFYEAKGVKTLVVTHGPDPFYAYSDGTVFKKMAVRTFPICDAITKDLKADPSKRGDSTGCGDNFSGGVLAYLAEATEKKVPVGQFDLVEAISWGCASGGFTLFGIGGTYIEKHPGEKRKMIDRYRQAYLRQIAAPTSKL